MAPLLMPRMSRIEVVEEGWPDDGQRKRPGRLVWDQREGWAVLVDPER
jgi:hypothetical protein